MTDQEKLNVLIGDFGKLEENRKEYIRELTQKLADIHCGGEFTGEYGGNEPAQDGFPEMRPT